MSRIGNHKGWDTIAELVAYEAGIAWERTRILELLAEDFNSEHGCVVEHKERLRNLIALINREG